MTLLLGGHHGYLLSGWISSVGHTFSPPNSGRVSLATYVLYPYLYPSGSWSPVVVDICLFVRLFISLFVYPRLLSLLVTHTLHMCTVLLLLRRENADDVE